MKISGILEIKDLLEHTGDGFFIANPEGKLLYCNPASHDLMGMNMLEYKSLPNMLEKRMIDRSTALEAVQKKIKVSGEVKSLTGKSVIATSSPVFDFKGNLDLIICMIRDYLPNHEADHNLQQELIEKLVFEDAYKKYQISGDAYNYELVFISSVMEKIIDLAVNLARVDSTVLICGETGVGKEIIASLIHDLSPRKKTGPFVKIDCASIPANLFESELFGYEPGSFTGAMQKGKQGYFELADKGTLFLDEIGELPLEIQPKMLTALQDRQVYKVGGAKAKAMDVRIIAATNRDLEQMVREGKFRQDLFYRLNVVPIEIPPLRERKAEIPILLSYFMNKYQQKYGLKSREISQDVLKSLICYPWPGNVRELANLVERLLILSKEDVIQTSDLPVQYHHFPEESGERFTVHDIAPLKEMIEDFETTVINQAMKRSKNQKEAAEMLGISFSSLSRKLRK